MTERRRQRAEQRNEYNRVTRLHCLNDLDGAIQSLVRYVERLDKWKNHVAEDVLQYQEGSVDKITAVTERSQGPNLLTYAYADQQAATKALKLLAMTLGSDKKFVDLEKYDPDPTNATEREKEFVFNMFADIAIDDEEDDETPDEGSLASEDE